MRGNVAAGVLILLALTFLVLPLRWVLAVIIAGAFHELCHYGAVRLCGGNVRALHAGFCGARMEVSGLTAGKELLCALAGPAGSLSLLFVARWLPRTAICGGFHAIFNLLPVYPLDGGRALRCWMAILLPPKAGERFCQAVEGLCLCAIVLLGIYGSFFLHLGFLPIMVALSVVIRVFSRKTPCKPGGFSVQ